MISVCMATYNGENFILEQMNSILMQLSCNDEIIVSDDGSSDKTVILLKSLGDNRIKILENNNFKNPIYNFENALNYAQGDYIFLSDQDDVWLEGKVKLMVEEINSGFDVVLSDCEIVDQDLKIINPSYFRFNNSGPGLIKNIFKNSYMGCCMAISKKMLNSCLPFPKEMPMHDSYIGLIGELKFKVKFIDKPLILHRKHFNNSSNTATGKSQYDIWQKIRFRVKLIFALLKKLNNEM